MPDTTSKLPARIGLTDEGHGAPVVLLHCSASSSRQWKNLRNLGSDRYRFLSLDLLGYGDTAFPANPAGYSIDDEVGLVERAMARVDGPVHLVGHSYGGAVALKTALRHPSRVRSVYAYEPVLFSLLPIAGREAEWREIRALGERMSELHAAGSPAAAMGLFVDYWGQAGAWDAMPESRQASIVMAAPKLMLEFGSIFNDPVSAGRYGTLPMPVRIAAGKASPPTSRAVAELLAEAIGRASLDWIEDAGHMAPLSDPDLVNPAILTHLALHAL